jgi:tetratricopeptide (TPR) repeat protein
MRVLRLSAFACWLFLGVLFTSCTEKGQRIELSKVTLQQYDSLHARGFSLILAKDTLAFWPFLDAVEKRAASEKSDYLRLRAFQLRQIYLERAGQLEQALAITEEVLLATEGRKDLDPIRLEALFNKGNLSFQLGQYQTAFQSYFNATNAEVSLTIPSNFTISPSHTVSAGTWSATTKKWTLGTISPGSEEVLELTLTASSINNPSPPYTALIGATYTQTVFGTNTQTALTEGTQLVDL